GLYSDPAMADRLRGALPGGARLEPVRTGLFSPRSGRRLDSALRRLACPFYVTPNYLGLPPRRRAGRVRVAVVHDLIPWEIPDARRGNPKWRIFYGLPPVGRRLLTSYDHLVAVSARTAEALGRLFRIGEDRVTVIPGAPASHFTPDSEGDGPRLRRLGVTPPYLLFVGRDDRHKNVARLIESHRRLPESLRAAYPLVLAGEPRRPRIDDRRISVINELDDADLPALYRGARFVVLPSLLEGFGLPVVEAMACGTPLLLSDRAPLDEIAGDAARYFDPEDGESMTRVIGESLRDGPGWEAAATAARRRAGLYSWERSAAALLCLLSRLGSEAAR
ncbi:MAG: glycosyltransferase, partial [Candidatus Eisenbacteria bacterium]